MARAVAVLGAGNGGLAAAGDLTLRGYEVRLFSRSRETLAPVVDRGGIQVEGAAGEGFARVAKVTNDLAEAVAGADLVMLVVPITGHGYYGRALAPILADGQPVLLDPGHVCGGLHFVAELRRSGYRGEVRCCEVSTLSYGCRIQEPARVRIMRVVTDLAFAAFPGKHAGDLYPLVREVLPNVIPARDVLETAFSNANSIEHPPQTILNAGWVEHTKGDYCFYYEGTTPSVGRVIDAVDRERMAVARALGVPVKSFIQTFYEHGYTTKHALEVGTAYQALQESAPNRYVKGPKSLDHRYVHEDVGFGLVPFSQFGDLAGVDTPVMDHLIGIASVLNDRDYAREGLTLEKMGLAGMAIGELEGFLYEGRRA